MTIHNTWTPGTWRQLPARQQPQYEDNQLLGDILSDISRLPPLVRLRDIFTLRQQLALAGAGQALVLQGGDCAERFVDCTPEAIARKLQLLQRMSQIISAGDQREIVQIGRIAGQYAKPRSADHEQVNGISIPCFRGDNIHSFNATSEARVPDPERLRLSYHFSALTRNFIDSWMRQYNDSMPIYSSHEGLLLNYEQVMTRWDSEHECFYNSGAHMLWLGDRTRALNEAHVEYFRGIANPIGVKISAAATPTEVLALVRILNPQNLAGKVVLITRLGCAAAAEVLSRLIPAVQQAGLAVVWFVDPMHGNLIKTVDNIKTRSCDDVIRELDVTFKAHHEHGSILAGVHLEMTGEDVTECLGGRDGVAAGDLLRNYQTYCDPRLNRGQAIDIAHTIANLCERYPQQRVVGAASEQSAAATSWISSLPPPAGVVTFPSRSSRPESQKTL